MVATPEGAVNADIYSTSPLQPCLLNNGETQTWHLGQGTVQALKELVAIR